MRVDRSNIEKRCGVAASTGRMYHRTVEWSISRRRYRPSRNGRVCSGLAAQWKRQNHERPLPRWGISRRTPIAAAVSLSPVRSMFSLGAATLDRVQKLDQGLVIGKRVIQIDQVPGVLHHHALGMW